MNADYKTKIKILQDDLATSEQVQKDFVKLSQSLQVKNVFYLFIFNLKINFYFYYVDYYFFFLNCSHANVTFLSF